MAYRFYFDCFVLTILIPPCQIYANQNYLCMQGKPLLAPGRAGELNQAGRVVVPIIRGRACLPDLSITGAPPQTNRAKPLFHAFCLDEFARCFHLKPCRGTLLLTTLHRIEWPLYLMSQEARRHSCLVRSRPSCCLCARTTRRTIPAPATSGTAPQNSSWWVKCLHSPCP